MINNFVHVQFNVPDINKAKEFYSQLFSWNFFENPEVDEEIIYFQVDEPGDFMSGSFFQKEDVEFGTSTFLVINVERLTDTLNKVEELGGEITQQPNETKQFPGYHASFKDNQGLKISIWSEQK